MAEKTFSILHLSLVPKAQPTFETFRGSREEWLRHALSREFEFVGWGKKRYVWLPKSHDDEYIIGIIQGQKPYVYHDSPELGGEERRDDFWQGAYVFIDPTHHEDGQKIGVENDVLGRPHTLAKSLFDHINALIESPFTCIPELVFDESDFWKFSERSGNVVKFIRFEFVVPNMWGPQNDLEEDLRETGRETGSDRVDVTFRGRNGVKTNSDKVKDGVKYAGRGAGRVTARNFDGEKFSSDLRPTVVQMDGAEEIEHSQSGLYAAASKILKNE